MKGLDLRKLKKVSSDDKMTIFKHEMGHEIKIAHRGLSPKMMEELKGIPMHGKAQKMAAGGYPQKMAEGDEPNPQPNLSPDDNSPKPQAPVNIYVGGQQGQPQQSAPVPAQSAPGASNAVPPTTMGANPNSSVDESIDPNSAEAPAPDSDQSLSGDQSGAQPSAPSQVPPPPVSQPPTAAHILMQPLSAGATVDHLNDETAKLQGDYNNGVITPKTYSDLFAKNSDGTPRGALGKIGMLFGLMVGGAGSGLAHQQNALLGMMDKEIDRDLEAQKHTKTNQYNALTLAENHYKDEVAKHLTQQQGALTAAQTAQINANLPLLANNLAKSNMELAVEQEALRKAGYTLPNTPIGQASRAAVGNMSSAIRAQQLQRNQRVAQQIEANGQQVQQQSQSSPMGDYITTPDDDATYKALGFLPEKVMPSNQKDVFTKQYLNAKNVEQKMPELEATFNEMRKKETLGGNLSERISPHALAGVGAGLGAIAGESAGVAAAPYTGGLSLPAGHAAAIGLGSLGAAAGEASGQGIKTGLRAIGGQQQTDYETAEAKFEKLLASMLANTPITDTARGELVHKFKPTWMDTDRSAANKLQKMKEAVIDAQDRSALTSSRPKK